jgi:hypothetical protein
MLFMKKIRQDKVNDWPSIHAFYDEVASLPLQPPAQWRD